jgi:uncharacterized protein YndB with AHSA1/START domain
MGTIAQQVTIRGTPEKVYEALTQQSGYRGWWNKVGEVDQKPGGFATLRFVKDGQPVDMRFRIDATERGREVKWTCLEHTAPPWVGTTLNWKLAPAGEAVNVSFEHGGWEGAAPQPVIDGWKHFLGSLKTYVETGTGSPW